MNLWDFNRNTFEWTNKFVIRFQFSKKKTKTVDYICVAFKGGEEGSLSGSYFGCEREKSHLGNVSAVCIFNGISP